MLNKMSDIIQDLLKSYYGFGQNIGTTQSLTSHEGAINRQNSLQKSISTEYLIDVTDGNSFWKHPNTETNDSDKNSIANDSEETTTRSWRTIIDDENTNVEDIFVIDGGLTLDTKELCNDIISDDRNTGTNVVAPTGKDEAHNVPATSQASLGILQVLIQDNVSEISSSLASKNKAKKKSRVITSASITQPQLPPLPFNSPARKSPTYNEEFFDMSNAFIAAFPIDLLDGFHNIKMLYLGNNSLQHLPDELFTNLKFLQWLDLRHNKLTNLPTTLKHHSSLETILLQANQFERLPLELGVIPNLKGLQIQDNPLIYPPTSILSLGFTAIINFLRKQWNANHPDEMVEPPQEVKSTLTILCHEPPTIQNSSQSPKTSTNSSSIILPKLSKSNPSIRDKSWNYKPSNRCDGSVPNAMLDAKLQWISKVKKKLNEQAAILQRIKDHDVLKNWRQDRRSFHKSINKATNRTGDDIPFGVDYTDIPFLNKQQQQPQKGKRINSPRKDVNIKMSEISTSLQQLQTEKQSGKLDVASELKRLQEEIVKLSNLQRQIHNLKNQNETAMSKYDVANSSKLKITYNPPPSIIL